MIEGMPASNSTARPIGRRPALRPQEREAVFLHRRPCTCDQRNDDAAEDEKNRDRADPGDPVEGSVSELECTESPGAIIRSGGFHHIALNGHVCHANPLLYFILHGGEMRRPDIAPVPAPTRKKPTGRRGKPLLPDRIQLLISEDQVFSISLTTPSGICM